MAERWRGVVLILVGASTLAAALAVDLGQRQDILAAQERLTAAGQYVYVARPANPAGSIDAGRCVALGHIGGVISAGGFLTTRDAPTRIARAPGWTFNLRTYVGDLPRVLTGRPTPPVTGVAVDAGQAGPLGLMTGSRVRLEPVGTTVVLAVLDIAQRMPDPGAWLLAAAAGSGELTECWAEFEPSAAPLATGLMHTWLRSGESEAIVSPLLPADELRASPRSRYDGRPTKFAPLAAGLILGMVHGIVLWFRRAEVALYRSVGFGRIQAAAVFGSAGMALTAVSAVMGTLYAVLIATLQSGPLSEADVAFAIVNGSVAAGMAMLTQNVAALAISSGSVAEHIRERL